MSSIDFMTLWQKYMPANSDSNGYPMAMYAVGGSGKRVRPTLLLDSCQGMGECDDSIFRLAVALECMHSYSLVHDDLPCMDNDSIRRGKPTCHVQFGYAEAVLAGDYLLNSCAEILMGGSSNNSYMASCKYLMQCGRHMIEGQYLDIAGVVNDYQLYQSIASQKTGALLCASLVCPAIYYNMSDIVIDKLKNIGNMLGIIYQIVDDLGDANNKECSILNIFSEDECTELLNKLHSNIDSDIQYLHECNIPLNYLDDLIDALLITK